MLIKEYKYWRLSLAESQILIGWTHASLKRHILFFEELRDEELIELKKIIMEIKETLNKTFKPDWFNVMQLGNMTPHLHFQLVPRYKEKRIFVGREFIDKSYGRPILDEWIEEDNIFLKKLRNYIKKEMKN
ncbi:MAG: HIT family protein [Nanoarchaeota archaeon]|nr:HIT family protein [Nanoarchaeota archaeon]MBU1597723.1 HIT family protein [Nanoarchaeota archaeon]MBU2442105.1 HIT family protein [Nanoarchaeota archaeon]